MFSVTRHVPAVDWVTIGMQLFAFGPLIVKRRRTDPSSSVMLAPPYPLVALVLIFMIDVAAVAPESVMPAGMVRPAPPLNHSSVIAPVLTVAPGVLLDADSAERTL